MSAPDYYRILRVEPDAPLAIVHASYRTLLQRARGAADSAAQIALLDEAYAVLGDVARRTRYDAQRGARRAPALESPSHRDDLDTRAAHVAICLFCGTPHGRKGLPARDDDCGQCGSPLCPAERQRLDYSGRRVLARIPKQRAIEVRVTWPQPAPIAALMRDLSLNGMLFTAPMRLEQNQIVRVDCTELRALARVAHTKRDSQSSEQWLTGVEFLTLKFWQVRGAFVSTEV